MFFGLIGAIATYGSGFGHEYTTCLNANEVTTPWQLLNSTINCTT